jgi:L-fuconolactonase
MQIVDAQVHAYERNHPGRPWIGHLHGPASATGDEMVAAMDAAGVDGALLVSPYSFYRYDASYALEVGAAHPGRCGLIKPVDPNDLAVEENIADWAKAKGAVAIRILLTYEASEDPADLGMNRILAAASRHSLPVNLLCWGGSVRPRV